VDPNDEAALVRAVRGSDVHVAFCAASALSAWPANPLIDDALLQATKSYDESVAVTAAGALAAHQNFEWSDDMLRRFSSFKDPLWRIRISGTLALGGHYDGWPYLVSMFTQKQPTIEYPMEALWEVGKFAGMKDEHGQPVKLDEVLGRLYATAPVEYREMIRSTMIQVGPPPPGPKRDTSKAALNDE